MRWIGALFFVAALAIWPGVALEAARGAMEAWATSVAPALFPFVAAIPALTCPEARMAYEKWLGKAMRALFHVPASASGAIVIGFLAGSRRARRRLSRLWRAKPIPGRKRSVRRRSFPGAARCFWWAAWARPCSVRTPRAWR